MNIPDCMYEYKYERQSAKKVKSCKECKCDVYVGETAYIIGNDLYCEECVRKVVLEDEG